MIADLHCHSHVSDGSLPIREVVALAKRLGVQTLAIADHDTVAGLDEAAAVCRENGIINISAIEISAYDYQRERKAHLLGYLIDKPEQVGEACQPMLLQRQANARWMVDTIQQAGYPLTWELVESIASGSTNVYKQHIMHALMDLGYATGIHDALFQKLFGKPKAGQPGGIAVRNVKYIDVFEAVKVIKDAGAIAVLAHPAGYRNLELIPELVNIGLDGLEAWHPMQDEASVIKIQELAATYNLLLTGGSDFHGMYESRANPLGSQTTPEDWLNKLYARK